MWFLIYLVIGMVYSGLTFMKLNGFILENQMDREEIMSVVNDKPSEETKRKVAAVFIVAILVTLAKIFIYPLFIVLPIGKKLAKVVK